jgi:hypothetical protein
MASTNAPAMGCEPMASKLEALDLLEARIRATSPLLPLLAQSRWVVWRLEGRNGGKPSKVPHVAARPSLKASSKSSQDWCDFETALSVAHAHNFDGVSFVLSPTVMTTKPGEFTPISDPHLCAFDLDDCRDAATGVLAAWAQAVVEECASYTEITPSGTGLRIIGYGRADPPVHDKRPAPDAGSCEIFRKASKIITITGDALDGWDRPLANIDAAIDHYRRTKPDHEPEGGEPQSTDYTAKSGDMPDWIMETVRHGAPEGKRSDQFFRVVRALKSRGWAAGEIEALLADHPNGIASKYWNRLRQEVGRVYHKEPQEPGGGDPFERAAAEADADAEPTKKKRAPTQAETLLRLADAAELFHSADNTAYADVVVEGHRQTHAIRSKNFKQWLARAYHQETGGAVSSEAREGALGVLEARALFDGPEREVHVRVAGLHGKIYIDLGDATWRAIEIDANGWRLIDAPPVRFRRAKGAKPLPTPQDAISIEPLRKFLNVQSDNDFVLIVCWLLSCLRPRGPYPLLVLAGEQGSAKSTLCTLLRALVDPNTAGLRALPREDRDLFIAATNAHLLCYDNLSTLPAGVSDTFCRLATGGGFAVRSLYTDGDEALFNEARPVLLNGISDVGTRPDLAERAIFLTLQPISESSRKPEEKLLAEFEAMRPQIIGALLTGVARGLSRLEHTKLKKLPRMADFALWGTACESAFWPDGTFAQAYEANRDDAVSDTIEADPVAMTVKTLWENSTETWSGKASDLLAKLNAAAGDHAIKSNTWPGNARALSGRLR